MSNNAIAVDLASGSPCSSNQDYERIHEDADGHTDMHMDGEGFIVKQLDIMRSVNQAGRASSFEVP